MPSMCSHGDLIAHRACIACRCDGQRRSSSVRNSQSSLGVSAVAADTESGIHANEGRHGRPLQQQEELCTPGLPKISVVWRRGNHEARVLQRTCPGRSQSSISSTEEETSVHSAVGCTMHPSDVSRCGNHQARNAKDRIDRTRPHKKNFAHRGGSKQCSFIWRHGN